MKQINKSSAPQWFEQWKSDFVEVNNRQPHYKVDFAGNEMCIRDRDKLARQNKNALKDGTYTISSTLNNNFVLDLSLIHICREGRGG